MKRQKSTRIPDAATELAAAEVISLKAHKGFDEAWLQQQIIKNPAILRLSDGKIEVVRSQLRQDRERRLDLLLKAAEEDTYYSVELMLGELNPSHLVRAIDYWRRNQEAFKDKDWDHVPVVVAERIGDSGCRRVAQWLSEVSPLVAIELRAILVGGKLAVEPFKVLDGRDVQEELDLTQPQVEVGRDYWIKKSSEKTVKLAEEVGSLLSKVDSKLRLSYKQSFLGVTAQNRPANFMTFNPKRNFVRAWARVVDSDAWAKKLKHAGFEVMRVRSGRSLQFRIADGPSQTQRRILVQLCQKAYDERFPDEIGTTS